MPKFDEHRERAPYHTQMRAYERQLVTDVLKACGDRASKAAILLGVSGKYIRDRAEHIGGFLGHPVYEPPRSKKAIVAARAARAAIPPPTPVEEPTAP